MNRPLSGLTDMDERYFSLAEACAELHISAATGRNWLRLGKLAADGSRRGRPVFSESHIAALKERIASEDGRLLKSRRNKRYISGSSLYRSYVSEGSRAVRSVEQTLALLLSSGAEACEAVIRLLLADAALQMLRTRSGQPVCHLTEWTGWEERLPDGRSALPDPPPSENREEHSPEIPPSRPDSAETALIRSLAGDEAFARQFIRQHPALFTADYVWEPGEDALGLLYLSCRDLGARKSSGAYYTPVRIVRQLIRHLTEADPDFSRKTILDPCCGSGNFLLQLPDDIPLSRIYGNDIDPVSVVLARVNLALKYRETDPALLAAHITRSDALLEPGLPDADVILGNPPWGCEYDSRQLTLLQAGLSCAAGRHAESGDLFLEKAVRSLPVSGRVSFVLPEAVLNVGSHRLVRECLLRDTSLEVLDFLGNAFRDVHCPSIILQLRKTGMPMKGEGMTVSLPGRAPFTIREARPVSSRGLPLAVPDGEYRILRKLQHTEGARTLKGSAVFALGIVTGGNKTMISSVPEEGREPVLRGSDLFRYRCRLTGSRILFQPESFQQCAPESVYRAEEKLLYRFICSQPVFAYDNHQTLSLNSANILIPRIEGLSCKYILAVLNSRVVQFFCERSFRSVKLLRSHIEQIPIPDAGEAEQDEIRQLADQLLTISGAQREEILRLYDQVDEKVRRLYHLTDEEYAVICESSEPRFLYG